MGLEDGDIMTVLLWDWKGQPDLNRLDKAVRDASRGAVAVTQVDTHSDEYAIVVGPPMTKDEAHRVWRATWDE